MPQHPKRCFASELIPLCGCFDDVPPLFSLLFFSRLHAVYCCSSTEESADEPCGSVASQRRGQFFLPFVSVLQLCVCVCVL
jgi:hypothetical protein